MNTEQAENIIRNTAGKIHANIRVLRPALREIKRSLGRPEYITQDVKFWIAECERMLELYNDEVAVLNDRCKEIQAIVK